MKIDGENRSALQVQMKVRLTTIFRQCPERAFENYVPENDSMH